MLRTSPIRLLWATTGRPRTSSGIADTSHIPWQMMPLTIAFSAKARFMNSVAGASLLTSSV